MATGGGQVHRGSSVGLPTGPGGEAGGDAAAEKRRLQVAMTTGGSLQGVPSPGLSK